MGQHYICRICNYEWRSRKDVGFPSSCPHCRSSNIITYFRFTQLKEKYHKEGFNSFYKDYINNAITFAIIGYIILAMFWWIIAIFLNLFILKTNSADFLFSLVYSVGGFFAWIIIIAGTYIAKKYVDFKKEDLI